MSITQDLDCVYAVAYLDENGKGFSKTEPWIDDIYEDDLSECSRKAKEIIEEGFKNVTLFKYVERLDYYDWDYVNRHKIPFT